MDDESKRVAISGASGLVGTALSEHLTDHGWSVTPMVRHRDREGIYWSVDEETVDVERLEGFDAVVHLAGESIADGRWTDSHKEAVLKSRAQGTELISGAIASLEDAPEVFISSSGAHYYGASKSDEWVDEDDEAATLGDTFLTEVCRQWEAACDPARDTCRVVNTRLAPVLSEQGGMLAKMLTPFKLGIGGRLGDGRQYMSWVVIDDVVRAMRFVLEHDELEGPVNVAAPNPVTNREFTKTLGKVLSRPTLFPVPSPALKVMFGGQMAEEMMLNGQRVRPSRLVGAGFEFENEEIGEALEATVG